MDNPMNDSIESIKNLKEKMKDVAAAEDLVKDGTMTQDEELQEPSYVLFNAIAETSIKLLETEPVIELFKALSEKLGPDVTKKLIEALTMMLTNSAYEALTFYDELLKEELTKQFENIGDVFANIGADVKAHNGAMEVFKKRLDDLERLVK